MGAVAGPVMHILTGLGLSGAAGLNAYVPLLAVGILSRLGYLHLNDSYSLLASWPVLIVLGLLAVVDFIADKVPAVDHAWHAIGAFVAPVAGAVVFATQSGAASGVPPSIALALGFLLAGGFHATRAAVRPVATATTGGTANAGFSLAEDATAVTLSMFAVFVPVLGALILVALIVGLIKAWKSVRSGWQRLRSGTAFRRGPAEGGAR
jgi:hypothetical protein